MAQRLDRDGTRPSTSWPIEAGTSIGPPFAYPMMAPTPSRQAGYTTATTLLGQRSNRHYLREESI